MREELFKFFESVIRNIDGFIGRKLRYVYYRRRLGQCGKNVVIEPGVFFQNPSCIYLHDNIWIDRFVILIAGPFNPGGRKFIKRENHNYHGEPGHLILGNGVHIAPFALLQAHGGLSIGTNVTVASGAKVYSLSHHHSNLNDPLDNKRYSFSTMAPVADQFLILSPVVIDDNAAVGLNSVVLPGTTLKSGTWLGVLSYLTPTQSQPNATYLSVEAHKK